jgi:hypothetical protein
MVCNGIGYYFGAPFSGHTIAKAPTDYKAGVQVDDGAQLSTHHFLHGQPAMKDADCSQPD